MHTYQTLESGSQLIVVANTRFPFDRPEAWDTYSTEEFRKLQQELRQQR